MIEGAFSLDVAHIVLIIFYIYVNLIFFVANVLFFTAKYLNPGSADPGYTLPLQNSEDPDGLAF